MGHLRAIAAARQAEAAERARHDLALQLDRRMGELFSLQELSYVLSESLHVDRIGEQVARYTLRFLNAQGAFVLLAEPGGGPFRLAGAEGDVAHLAGRIVPRDAEGLAVRAFDAAHIETQTTDGPAATILPGLAARTAAIAPLRAHGVSLGVIGVTGHRSGPFTAEDLSLLSTVATHTAVVLANARFVEMVHRGKEDWETAFDALSEGVAVLDADGRLQRGNRALARILGLPVESLAGAELATLLGPGGEGAHGMVEALRRNEQPPPLQVRLPGEGRILRLTAARVTEGRAAAGVVLVEDVTDQRALETQLLQNEKLAAVGQLVSGVAHELNNPLTSIAGLAELLSETSKTSPEAKEHLHVIRDQAERAGRIVRNLLTFSRKGDPERTHVDLNEVVERTTQLVAYELRIRGITLDEQLAQGEVAVQGDLYELQSVVLNLLTNAIQSVGTSRPPGSGVVRIETAVKDGQARLSVTDNGPGVQEAHLPMLFTPFFTTKEPGQGTGLGLSISYGIAEAHRGRLEYAHAPKGGAIFTLRLPAAQAKPAGRAAAGKRILLVDDDPKSERLVAALFRPEGHVVEATRSGSEALVQVDEDRWDAVLVSGRLEWPGRGPAALALLAERPGLQGRLYAALPASLVAEGERFRAAGIRTVGLPFDLKELRGALAE
ncbi:MAG TPA: ATP-binding protein [Gemmatimonadales bacterium]|nr:ATP-binding protein [Gemmatimonadales bacterium]